MKFNESIREIEARTGIQKIVLILLAAMITGNFILVLMAFTNKSSHRETLIPPDIYKTFWVDGENIGPEYLELMGKFILDLAVNNTPLNCDTNKVLLLKYTGSDSYSALNTQLSTNCEIVRSGRISSFFAANTVSLRPEEKSAVFLGSWSRWMGDRLLNPRPTAFRVRFSYTGGKVYVKALDEVDPRAADLFADSATKKDVMEDMRAEQARLKSEGKAIDPPATSVKTPDQQVAPPSQEADSIEETARPSVETQ